MAALLLALPAIAAEPALPGPLQARFRGIDSSQGLSQDSVMALVQDRHGFVWMGTQDGLNRYDGHNLRTYRSGESEDTLASGWVYDLKLDAQGELWVATADGLHRQRDDEGRFARYRVRPGEAGSLPGNVIYRLHLDAAGRLWVGSDGGLSQWRPDRGDFDTWTPADRAQQPAPHVRAIAEDGDGGLWLGTEAGLLRYDIARRTVLPSPVSPLDGQAINDLLRDADGRLWVASDQEGVFVRSADGDRWQRFAPDVLPALPHRRTHRLMQDRGGDIWVGHEAGVTRFRAGGADRWQAELYRHRPFQPRGLGRGRVSSILQTTDGSLWLGTWDGGASVLNRAYSRFLSFTPESEATAAMRAPQVHSLVAEGETLWLGTLGGLFRFDPQTARLEGMSGTEGLEVFAVALAPDSLWIGTGSGLWRLDRRSGRVQRVALPAAIGNARIRRLLVDGDRLWLFAELAGLYVFEGPQLRLLAQHRFSANVNRIQRLNAHSVVVCASDGLYWLDGEGRQIEHRSPVDPQRKEGQLPERPTGIERDSLGGLWVSTYGGGVLRLLTDAEERPQSARFVAATAGLGLRNEGVNALMLDLQERLWLATDRGISRYDPLLRKVRNFDAFDGAIARGYYFAAAARTDSGLIAFGSKDGFTVFDPAMPAPDALPPAPLLLGLQRDNVELQPAALMPGSPLPRSLHLLQALALPPGGGRSFAFDFASPELVMPQRLRYRYRLDDFDPDWVPVSGGRLQASYTNVAPGRYRFRVQALDAAGPAGAETVLALEVQPFWWQTGVARVAAAVLLLAMVLLLHLWRVRALNAQHAVLRAEVDERTQALNESKRRAEAMLLQLRSAQESRVGAEQALLLSRLAVGLARQLDGTLAAARAACDGLAGLMSHLRSPQTVDPNLPATLGGQLHSLEQAMRQLDEVHGELMQLDTEVDNEGAFALDDCLTELRPQLDARFAGRGIDCRVACAPGLRVRGRSPVLAQVLLLLADNAARHGFVEAGGIVWINARRIAAGEIELRFADNGRGIAGDALEQIFQPFAGSGGRPGLGLFIVRQLLARGFGGGIEAKSVPGMGSEFVLSLPEAGAAAETASTTP
ncbi:MAG TPA: two-component regulator propeller domain-containing protein [Arenimonas sp.]|nr:two-component regulator propeller domain-containing protein [Arenimonas sp.]